MRCHGLDAVGEIYLVWWLANAGLRACHVAPTVQLCRGDDTVMCLFLRGRGLAGSK